MFDIRIVNLDAGSYLRMTPEKTLVKVEKENKDLHLQTCLEQRRAVTPIVYSVPTSSIDRKSVVSQRQKL